MKNQKRLARLPLFYLILALVTIGTIALRCVALLVSFQTEIGYFESGALPILLYVLEGVAAAFCLVFPFLINKEEATEPTSNASLGNLVTAGLCALAMIATAITLFLKMPRNADGSLTGFAILYVLTALLLLAGSAYFLLKFCEKQSLYASLPLGFIAVPSFALLLGVLYFDLYTPMNAPHKVSLQVVLLAVMIALLYELRVSLEVPRPRAAAAVYGFTAFACTSIGASNTVAFLVGTYQGVIYLLVDLLAVAFGAYFTQKCVAIARKPKECEV